MPLDSQGNIAYKNSPAGEPQYQANPPICNHCGQEITQRNFGWAYLVHNGGKSGEAEFIECTACTPVREGGKALRIFLARHNLSRAEERE
jgi:hypothetical protein